MPLLGKIEDNNINLRKSLRPAPADLQHRQINIEEATETLREGSGRRMSEVKIARFVGIEACKSIFSEKSTFVLRSPEHYRRLYFIYEGGTAIGDRNEGIANTNDGGTTEFTGFIASCWTILKGDKPTSDEWDIFKGNEQNIVAIVSTPSKVCEFLDEALETNKERTNRRFPFHPVEHKGVSYGNKIAPTESIDAGPFNKDVQFKKQNEYRFVLRYAFPEIVDSFVFCGGIDYMEKCFVNSKMRKEQKDELRLIIRTAMAGYGDFDDKQMGDIIANVEDIF